MNYLLLGIDSLIACAAIGAIVEPGSRLRLAALFGVADGVGFLIGAGLGWQVSAGLSAALTAGILVGLGLYLFIVAAGASRVAAGWTVWVVPWALTLDNLAFGIAGEHSAGGLVGDLGQQATSSALLALAGLLVAVVLPRAVPAMAHRAAATRFAGGALVLAAGGFALLG